MSISIVPLTDGFHKETEVGVRGKNIILLLFDTCIVVVSSW